MEQFTKLQEKVLAAFDDVQKLKAGNKSAGERLRSKMQDVKVLAQEVREAALRMYPDRKEGSE